jgi:hypothetical protein
VDGLEPAEVVEAEVVEAQALGRLAQRRGHAAAERRRRVADADGAVPQHLLERLGDHPGGVREVDDPGVRRDAPGEIEHRRDRPQGEADAAGTGGLLAEHAVPERDALVDRPPLEAADADGDEHEVRALERVVEIGRGAERRLVTVLGGLAVEHQRDPVEPLGIHVVEDDLVERPPLEQRAVDERHAKAAAPDDRQLHAGRISAIPAAESSALGRNPHAGVRSRQGP